MADPTWESIVETHLRLVVQTKKALGAEFNPIDYGAKNDGVTDDTAAIQAAIDAASLAAGINADEKLAIVRLPSGIMRANGLVVQHSNVRIEGYGSNIRSFQAQATPQYILSFVGNGFDEGQLIRNNAMRGVVLSGANHANVRGLRLKGVAHFHYYHGRLRSFGGAGGGHAIGIENTYDCGFWGGFVDWSGNTGTDAATAIPALAILSSTIDNCNQLYFYDWTFESNTGVDVAIVQPAGGSTYYNNAISFIGCKWEQSAARTVWRGVYVPDGFHGSLSFEGKNYVAGYHRDGGWLDANLSGSGKVTISPSTDFAYKTDQAAGVNTKATIICKGTGKFEVGGRLSVTREQLVPFIDLTGKSQLDLTIKGVTCDNTTIGKSGFTVIGQDGSSARMIEVQGQLHYVAKLAPNKVLSFFPLAESGFMFISAHDRPTSFGMAAVRLEKAGSASVVSLANGGDIEYSPGTILDDDVTTTAGKCIVKYDTVSGKFFIQNRQTFSLVFYVRIAPTDTF